MARTSTTASGVPSGHDDVTALLHAWAAGDFEARERVLVLVYAELRRRAAAQLRRERPDHTLQPTALVHEAYIRLVDQRRAGWQNRAQFLAIASGVMRRILVDGARARRAAKRRGGIQLPLDEAEAVAAPAPDVDILDLDAALERLSSFDPRKGHIAEMRFFGGLSLEETGHVLQVSGKTVERDWQAARAWLFRELSPRSADTIDDA
jgi:RNA polymerase sigma factor (TIGR02999 family)